MEGKYTPMENSRARKAKKDKALVRGVAPGPDTMEQMNVEEAKTIAAR